MLKIQKIIIKKKKTILTLKNKNVLPFPLSPISQDWIWASLSLSLSLSSLQIELIGDGFSLSLALFAISSELLKITLT